MNGDILSPPTMSPLLSLPALPDLFHLSLERQLTGPFPTPQAAAGPPTPSSQRGLPELDRELRAPLRSLSFPDVPQRS